MKEQKNKNATLKDIAKITGFSTTSVSVVLNNKKNRIPESSKQRIIETAKKLGYHPNQIAVGLVKKKTCSIGLVIPDISNLFFATLTKSIEKECRILGYNVILCCTEDTFANSLSSIQLLSDKSVDGLILGMSIDMDLEKANKCKDLLDSYNIPFITVDRYIKKLNCVSVISDSTLGTYLGTKHLIENGHTKIACITGPTDLSGSQDRLNGVKKALIENQSELLPENIVEGDYSLESGQKAFYKLKGKDITAVFAFNGLMTYGFYREAKLNGVRIPEDLSLVGFDELFFIEMLETPITTVKQLVSEMGIQAASTICAIIEKKNIDEEDVILKPELIIRKSVKNLFNKE